MQLIQISENKYQILGKEKNDIEAYVYLQESLKDECLKEKEALAQLMAATQLPGVISPVLGMPDIHMGFGLPIGGVMATDGKSGVVSAGAVGMDINCGVRLLTTNLTEQQLVGQVEKLLPKIEEKIPTGIGKKSNVLYDSSLVQLAMINGAKTIIQEGYGQEEELVFIEEGGVVAADLKAVSKKALNRANQLGTLGGGNHFLEIGVVEEVFSPEIAEVFGLVKNNVTIMIHTGSRGFGHQICTDYSNIMLNAAKKHGIDLPNKGLAAVPINSEEGQNYLHAMGCAVNFAFANRQLISHLMTEAFCEVFSQDKKSLGIKTVYDVAHNIAKFEEYDGKLLLIHRKGATRALPKGHLHNPTQYMTTGHPAIIPGTMGTSSYVVVGTPEIKETFCSVNHGAGRVMSRSAARKNISATEFKQAMEHVYFKKEKTNKLLDEAPTAYKDIELVIETLAAIGLTTKVAQLRPLAVIKGEGD